MLCYIYDDPFVPKWKAREPFGKPSALRGRTVEQSIGARGIVYVYVYFKVIRQCTWFICVKLSAMDWHLHLRSYFVWLNTLRSFNIEISMDNIDADLVCSHFYGRYGMAYYNTKK